MEKTRKHIETELQKYDDLYWEWHVKVLERESVINQLEHEVKYWREDVAKYDSLRRYYQELYNEMNTP